MRRFITHPLFFGVLLLVVVTMIFSDAPQTSWNSRFAFWTTKKNTEAQETSYMKSVSKKDVVSDIISAHVKLAATNPSFAWASLWWWTSIASVPQYLAQWQRLLMTDVVAYLENASDKESGIDTLIGQLTYYQTQWEQIQQNIASVIQEKEIDYAQCTTQKEEGDREFYQWIREWDGAMMQWGIEKAKKGASCQATARVEVNAHKAMERRVVEVVKISANLSSLLTQNRSTVLANFTLFKDTNLEKLISLRNQIRTVSPGTQ